MGDNYKKKKKERSNPEITLCKIMAEKANVIQRP